MDLPLPVADCHQVAFVTPVKESWTRTLLHLALEERNKVEPVEMDLEALGARLMAFLYLLDNIRLARRCQQGRQHVLVREDLVIYRARLDDARPPDRAWHTPTTLPVGVLFAAKWRRAAVRPTQLL